MLCFFSVTLGFKPSARKLNPKIYFVELKFLVLFISSSHLKAIVEAFYSSPSAKEQKNKKQEHKREKKRRRRGENMLPFFS